MRETVRINVLELVGSSKCVAAEDGQRLYDRISAAFQSGRRVSLSFQNVDGLTSAFLNPAIGQLYGEYSDDIIRENLTVEDMEPGDRHILKQVVETAKLYFREPERVRTAYRELVGDDDVD